MLDKSGRETGVSKDWREKGHNDEDTKAWLGINAKETNFFGLLQLIDEVTMIRFMGRDLTLYLKFLNYNQWMFGAILILQWTVLIPLYYSGEDAAQYLAPDEIEIDTLGPISARNNTLRHLESGNATT